MYLCSTAEVKAKELEVEEKVKEILCNNVENMATKRKELTILEIELARLKAEKEAMLIEKFSSSVDQLKKKQGKQDVLLLLIVCLCVAPNLS